jgi:hypothetical protein
VPKPTTLPRAPGEENWGNGKNRRGSRMKGRRGIKDRGRDDNKDNRKMRTKRRTIMKRRRKFLPAAFVVKRVRVG